MTNPSEKPLPAGWKWVKLGEVCIKGENVDPTKNPALAFRYIDISSIDRDKKVIKSPSIVYGKDAPSRARKAVKSGDVLVSTTRPNLNAVALVGPELDGEVCSTGLCVLRPGPDLMKEYLFRLVTTERFVRSLSDLVSGALYPAVTDAQVLNQEIPLPPLPEQRRIVARLDQQMAAVEKARLAAEEMLQNISSLRAAFLREIFALGKNLPSGWKWVKLGEITEAIRGVTFKQGDASYTPLAGSVPILRAGNISDKLNTSDDLVYVPDTYVSNAQKLQVNDIVICLSSGSASVVGKTAKLEYDWDGSVGAFCAILRSQNAETAEYLAYWFKSDKFLAWRDSQARGANIQNLRVSGISDVSIPLPPLAEQERIVAKLERENTAAGRAEALARQQLADIKAMPAALLREVFAGAV